MAEPINPGFVLSFEQRDGYLYTFVTGPKDSLDVSCRFWKEIQSKAIELGIRKVLVEESFPNQLPPMEMFQVAQCLAELFRSRAEIAHVDRRLADMDLNSFGETVAVNRGLLLRVFSSVEDAERWLMR